jgi:hypothetical protein
MRSLLSSSLSVLALAGCGGTQTFSNPVNEEFLHG